MRMLIHTNTRTNMDMRIHMNTNIPMPMAPRTAIRRLAISIAIRAICITALVRRTPMRPA